MKFTRKMLTYGMLLCTLFGCTEDTSNWPTYPAFFEYTGIAPSPNQYFLHTGDSLVGIDPSPFQLEWGAILHDDTYRDSLFTETFSTISFEFMSESSVRIGLITFEGEVVSAMLPYVRDGNYITIPVNNAEDENILLVTTEHFLTLEHCIRTYGKFDIGPNSNQPGYYPFYTDVCSSFEASENIEDWVNSGQIQAGDSVIVNLSQLVYLRTR